MTKKQKTIEEVCRKAGKASWTILTPEQQALRIVKMNQARIKKLKWIKKVLSN